MKSAKKVKEIIQNNKPYNFVKIKSIANCDYKKAVIFY